MRTLLTKRKAQGGWRASKGGIPVTGISKTYFATGWGQGLFSQVFHGCERRGEK
jgi:hypothetical protein